MHKSFGIVTMDFVLCETLLVKCLYAYKTVMIINKLAKVWPATVTMHYENMPMDIIYSNFFRSKIDNFQRKDLDSFLIFAQNIDCGYTLEQPPAWPRRF